MSIDIGTIYANLEIRNAGVVTAQLSKTTSTIQNFQRSMQIAAGVMMRDLFYGFIDIIREATDLGAEVETLKNSFESFTDAAGAQDLTLQRLRDATMGMVSDVDLLTQANRMLAAGLPTDQLEETFNGAIKLGKAMGIDASMAIEKLTLGLVRMSWRLMDDLGIIMRASTANEEYAKSIGVAASSLTAQQKQTAWVIYGIEQLTNRTKILGDNIGEADKMIDQFAASMTNLKTAIGENIASFPAITTLLNAFAPVVGIMLAQQFVTMSSAAAAAGTALTGFQAAAAMGVAVAPYLAFAAVIALLPTAIQGYGMALHDLRMRYDEVYAAQQRVNDSTDSYSSAVSKSDSAIQAYFNAQGKVQDAYSALLTAVDAYTDALRRQETLEGTLESLQRQKAVAYADFVAALSYVKGETESYHAVQSDLTWATKESELTFLSLQNTLWGLQDSYKSLGVEMDALRESDEDTTLAQMELRLQMDQLQLGYDKGTVKQKTYDRQMKRLQRAYEELSITQQKNRIEQFKLQDQMDETNDSMSETEDNINKVKTSDDQYEQVLSDLTSTISDIVELATELITLRSTEETAITNLQTAENDLATAYSNQWLALKTEAFWLDQVNKERQRLYEDTVKRDEERRAREEAGRVPDDTTPHLPEPSTPNMEPTLGVGAGDLTRNTTFSPNSNTTTLQVNIGSVVGTDKATAEKTGEAILSYVVRGLRTRGVTVR
jgi:hypothetical protein